MLPPNRPPILIVVGGPPGTGKTTVTKRLSSDLRIPRLGSDTIGRTVKATLATEDLADRAYPIAYTVLFTLCEDFVRSGVSTILDINLGWEFQWRHLDEIHARNPDVEMAVVILRCPLDVCLDRIRARHTANPSYYDPPEVFTRTPHIVAVRDYLERLDRPDAHLVDAARSPDEVCDDVRRYVMARATFGPIDEADPFAET